MADNRLPGFTLPTAGTDTKSPETVIVQPGDMLEQIALWTRVEVNCGTLLTLPTSTVFPNPSSAIKSIPN
jgi:hypothetical protein